MKGKVKSSLVILMIGVLGFISVYHFFFERGELEDCRLVNNFYSCDDLRGWDTRDMQFADTLERLVGTELDKLIEKHSLDYTLYPFTDWFVDHVVKRDAERPTFLRPVLLVYAGSFNEISLVGVFDLDAMEKRGAEEMERLEKEDPSFEWHWELHLKAAIGDDPYFIAHKLYAEIAKFDFERGKWQKEQEKEFNQMFKKDEGK